LTNSLQVFRRRWAERKPSGRLLLGFGLALLAFSIFGGKKGLFTLVSMQREKWHLEKEIESLAKANESLDAQCVRLERNPQLYEKVAREKLLLAKPGEIIYRFDSR
jgi:cell division protein FtsB